MRNSAKLFCFLLLMVMAAGAAVFGQNNEERYIPITIHSAAGYWLQIEAAIDGEEAGAYEVIADPGYAEPSYIQDDLLYTSDVFRIYGREVKVFVFMQSPEGEFRSFELEHEISDEEWNYCGEGIIVVPPEGEAEIMFPVG